MVGTPTSQQDGMDASNTNKHRSTYFYINMQNMVNTKCRSCRKKHADHAGKNMQIMQDIYTWYAEAAA
jgi:hypothetical protein